jgi:hypothetical protein
MQSSYLYVGTFVESIVGLAVLTTDIYYHL